MSQIPDEALTSYSSRVKGRVVVVTGAAKGIGRQSALKFASFGARVVIGDVDLDGANRTVDEIVKSGGEAVAARCDVTVWEDQVSLFKLAMERFGSVDIVLAIAGINERGNIYKLGLDKNGEPSPPDLKTLEVNLIGLVYTTNLAKHYLCQNHDPRSDNPKALVLIGSMASWTALPDSPLYVATKHAVLGLMRSMTPDYELNGIRLSCIHPFFTNTDILPVKHHLLTAGIPKAPIDRVAGAVFYSATSPGAENQGCAWMLLDDGLVFRLPKEQFKMGVYEMLDKRANALFKASQGVMYAGLIVRDVWRTFHLSKVTFLGVIIGAGVVLYRR